MSQRKNWCFFTMMRARFTRMMGKGGCGQRQGNNQFDQKVKVVALWSVILSMNTMVFWHPQIKNRSHRGLWKSARFLLKYGSSLEGYWNSEKFLKQVHDVLIIAEIKEDQCDRKMLWAACCICFFAFLRVGEMSVLSDNEYDTAVLLSVSDIAVDNPRELSMVWIHIKHKQLKTDPFRKGINLFVGRTSTDLCPVAALLGCTCKSEGWILACHLYTGMRVENPVEELLNLSCETIDV